jgi:hypothetical protein
VKAILAVALAAGLLAGCASSRVLEMYGPNRLSRVEVRERNGQSCIRMGPRWEGCFDGVAIEALTFSEDGRHAAYPVRLGDRWTVVRDGRSASEWDGVASLSYSPDGLRLAYAAFDGSRWRAVVDGLPGAPYDFLIAGSMTWDTAGTRIAYAAGRAGRTHVVFDALEGPGDAVRRSVSPDGPSSALRAIVRRSYGGRRAPAMRSPISRERRRQTPGYAMGRRRMVTVPYESVRGLAYRSVTGPRLRREHGGRNAVVTGRDRGPTESIRSQVQREERTPVAREDDGSVIILDGRSSGGNRVRATR